ncbi:response regulator transcription factor [Thalassotalea fusca]
MLVLLAEDEADLAELTIDYLEDEGIECDYAADGKMAINLLESTRYDVIVLDVNMPKADGFTVCNWLKEQLIDTPVIFLTARDSIDDKLLGFETGADDYLTKPFELDELVARLKVLARRKNEARRVFKLEDLTIDYAAHIVTRNNEEISLQPAQWQLLCLLAKHSPNVVSKLDIEGHVWPDQDVNKDMLKTLIFRLRTAIDREGQHALIHTIRGAGIALRA